MTSQKELADLEIIGRAILDGTLQRIIEREGARLLGKDGASFEEVTRALVPKEKGCGTWEEVGLALRHEKTATKRCVEGLEHLSRVGILPKAPEPPPLSDSDRAISDAIVKLRDGDFSGLVVYLRSEHPLSHYARECLAGALETDPAGRPRNESMWELVEYADEFYGEWRRRNKEAGIRDRSFCKRMQYLSCVYTIEAQAFFWRHPPNPEELLKNLRRSKKRRNKN